MFYPDVTRDYLKIILSDPQAYADEFRALLKETAETRRLYHGTTIPITYQGMFFEEKELALFASIIETMAVIGRKVTAHYVENPEYRPGFRFDKTTEELILLDPGYDVPVPVGRYDIFYNGEGDFKFCELNTDGSSAMNEDRVLGGILLNTNAMRELSKTWELKQFELFRTLVMSLTERYRKIKNELPRTVAIVDFVDKGTTLEFERFREVFRKEGYVTAICDPRGLRYENGTLYGTDVDDGKEIPIDMVYRRLVTSDLVERVGDCKALLDAYRDQAILCFGSFRSQIMHSKLIFAMLHDPMTKKILSAEENAFVEKHVPATYYLLTEEDRERVRREKDRYILKPYNSYASQGVLLGREHNETDWGELCARLPLDAYIYQEYVDVDPTPFVELPESGDGPMVETRLGHVIGLFMYDEKFAGSYTRVGAQGIISGVRRYYAAPAFRAKRK